MSDPQQPSSDAVPPVPSADAPAPPVPPGYAAAPVPPAYANTNTNAPTPPVYAGPPIPPPAYGAPLAPPSYAGPQAPPPGAYQVPVGGYTAPANGLPASGYQVPQPVEKRSSLLGILALVFAIVAAVVTPIIAGAAGVEIGQRLPAGIDTSDPDFLASLSPARDQVLWAEVSFWVGTILGIAAIVLGIIAIRRRQGRGAGVGALVVAGLGPIVFWVALILAMSIGIAAGSIAP
ncbi:hypothetical protein [Microbacterium sp. NPDC089695]|uniref:hypothetical protein n=1 Tax=Microbacterium sp. NPDC089695 TaxID=3364198 RepID=UPI0038300CFD